MMATCMVLRLREEPNNALRLATLFRRRDIGVAWPSGSGFPLPSFLLLWQPGLEKGKLSIVAARSACCPHLLVAPPFQRGTAKVVGLEGEQHDERHAGPAEQGVPLVARTEHPGEQAQEKQESDQLDPHAPIEEPEPRHQQRGPGESFLDEHERLGPVLRVSRCARWLI